MAPYLQNYLDLLLNSKQYYTHTYFKAETF